MKELILLALLVAIAACAEFVPSSNPATNACITSAGYSWCEKEGRCVRPWELAREKNLGNTKDSFENYCTPNTPPIGGVQDEHGCIGSAGYRWCEAENACVRPWEVANLQGLDGTKVSFDQYCANPPRPSQPIGSDLDEHNCIASAGYSWCEAEKACVRPWELARSKNLHLSGIASYCAGQNTPPIGGVKDEHGCIGSAGYRWCEAENACIRPWELANAKNLQLSGIDSYCDGQTTPPIGGVQDEHGCIASAGYSWCENLKECVRPWELANLQGLDGTKLSFDQYCANPPRPSQPIGGTQDEHGCIASAGYSWCENLKECVRPWEVANLQGLDGTKLSFDQYCANPPRPSQPIGSDLDEHNCIASAGYSWCEAEKACVRPWELVRMKNLGAGKEAFESYCAGARAKIGSDRDTHGCVGSAGYKWCAPEQKCVRVWELAQQKGLQLAEAQAYCA